VLPSGLTRPMPVTTTRFFVLSLFTAAFLHPVDCNLRVL
jgi:hypothetical protein